MQTPEGISPTDTKSHQQPALPVKAGSPRMKSTYTVTLISIASGSRTSLSQHTRKAEAVTAAKKGAQKGAFCEVLAEIPGVVPHVIFQGKTA